MQSRTVTKKSTTKTSHLVGMILVAGILIVLTIALFAGLSMQAEGAELPASISGWTTVFEENFESGIGPNWTVADTNGATNGEYYWATTSFISSEGSNSAWVTGGGVDGSLLTPGTDDYPNNALSSMIHDSVDLSGATVARLTFDYWIDSEATFDPLVVSASTDGSTYNNLAVYDGNSGGWQSEEISLNALVGESQVWIQFFFNSNASNTAAGAFVDSIRLESATEFTMFMPLIPKPLPPPYFYFDDYSDPSSGWPIVDNTHVSNDCFKWFYSSVETYRSDICDDRTDVKASPLVKLPTGDYEIEVDARFREAGGWWTAYGILFDAKNEPDPNKPDLGDYYMLWVLWEGQQKHKWKILKDVPGKQISLTEWAILDGSDYNYGSNGTSWNTWRVERTNNTIAIYLNDNHLRTINESRPTTNYQELFGLYTSTYETDRLKVAFDNYYVFGEANGPAIRLGNGQGTYISKPFSAELERMLPERELGQID